MAYDKAAVEAIVRGMTLDQLRALLSMDAGADDAVQCVLSAVTANHMIVKIEICVLVQNELLLRLVDGRL
jgi:hypothetical protein